MYDDKEQPHQAEIYGPLKLLSALNLTWISFPISSSHYFGSAVAYSTSNIIFEVVSAYGCVGISVSFPRKNYSFCGSWHTISKLILADVTLRGLPLAIDQAVMLPNESLAWAEEEDAVLRRERTRTYGSEKMRVGTV
ncbi:hypothetical protein CNMCM5793_005382 [Aspergillus hiratsukae]|uniref:Uncharacterized protein n=1 Tax=Aspergillus hiratsukae TaxID=1194566 RepID=A0A8H6QDX3_9EURO|nr:hypothetical protein CNMCM5793_005382 [Aspergillus hiratsukae]KAF7171311.1 hypothetical protein CNMCM6106_005744 [Aspergillus hiratsukae]